MTSGPAPGRRGSDERPQHPMAASIILVTGVVLIIVVLAIASTV
jgi:hypothetical protein